MTNTFHVAARLRAMDDATLAELIRVRGIAGVPGGRGGAQSSVAVGTNSSGSGGAGGAHGIRDFFDLADALFEPESIQRALSALHRGTLAALAALGAAHSESASERAGAPVTAADVTSVLRKWAPHSARAAHSSTPQDELVERHLTDAVALLLAERQGDGFLLYDDVRSQLTAWPSLGLPSGTQLAAESPPASLAVVPDTESRFTDRLASEHAFTAVNQVAHVIMEFGREPARELQRGGLALPDAKRIAAALTVELSESPTVLSIAARAGLVALEGNVWLPTRAGIDWQSKSTPDRWAILAASWLAALPSDVRALLSERAQAEWGDSLREYVAWAYPAGGDGTQQRVSSFVREAERLGITANDAPSHAGSLLLEGITKSTEADSLSRAAEAIAEHFPGEVERVYLQNDLTVVSPGPLKPAIDTRLRGIADQESRGLAATYRISPESINRAVADGETADSIRAFLLEVSATGIPQPLDYLITEATERYGRVRVAQRVDSGAGSLIRSGDAELLRTMEVDKALSSLGLRRDGPGQLASRRSREEVYWSLSEARYPIAAEDDAGRTVSLRRERIAASPNAHRNAHAHPAGTADAADSLVARLREGRPGDDDARGAWIARQLDIAVRGHIPVTVSVRMPDGKLVDYILEPTGAVGGRLRGKDRQADLERTLPLSHIESIEVAVDSIDNV